MTPEQIALVRTSFEKIPAEAAAALFYDRLFQLDPSLRRLFRGDMTEQGRRLMAMIAIAVRGLDDIESLLPAVRDLGRRHAGYGVRREHYATVGAALIWTLERGLGEAFTDEVRQAWTEVYGALSSTMIEAAAYDAAA